MSASITLNRIQRDTLRALVRRGATSEARGLRAGIAPGQPAGLSLAGCRELAAMGLTKRSRGERCSGKRTIYWATPAGLAAARESEADA